MRRNCEVILRTLFVIFLCISGWACGEDERVTATILPTYEGAALLFRGYVTDDELELVGEIYNFTRAFSHIDTLNGIPVFAFYSNKQKSYFQIDEAGTIRQLQTVDLTKRLLPYNIYTPKPIMFGYWETMLNTDEGVGTEWQVVVDTTIEARDSKEAAIQVRFHYSAKARFAGWGQTAIPESQRIQRVWDVHVLSVDNFIIDETHHDSLFVKRGTAHYYFDPEIGMIKYITDYKLKDRKHFYVSRHGTWELIEKKLPKGFAGMSPISQDSKR